MPETTIRHRAAALAIVVTFLWSTSWVLIRIGLDDELPPVTFAGLRYGLAAMLLVSWTPTRRSVALHVGRRQFGVLAALGVLMYALTQGAQFIAIDTQPAATTSLMLAMTPLLVALASAAVLREHTSALQRIGGVVIVGGASLYFGGELGATAAGMVAATVGLFSNAGSALMGRAVNRRKMLPPIAVTAVSMSVGAALLLAVGIVVEGLPALSARSVAIVAWLAIVNTAVAFTWWNQAQRHLTASEIAAINTTMVIQIPILAWIFLDEPLGVFELTGITLVAVGVTAMRSPARSGT